MRTIKQTLLIVSLALTFVQCGSKEKEIPRADASMAKNKFVRIVTDAVSLPFEFGEGTGVQGLDIDIGNEIAKDLGYETKWVKASPYNHLFELLQNGECELVISAIVPTEERKKTFLFSSPYFETGDTIARRRDKVEIKDVASLSGKKVGVQDGRPGEQFMAMQKEASNVTVVKFATLDDALGALNRTEIDAVVGDEPIMTYSIFKSFANLMTIGTLVDSLQFTAVVRQTEPELLAKVNATIDRLKQSGALEEMRKKWFQNVIEITTKDRQDMAEVETLKESPKSIACVINKTGGSFSMDRLDGFQLVLEGTAGNFQSTPILTDGNKGNCKFNQPIPTGNYKLNMTIFKMVTNVEIPKMPTKTLTLEMNIGASGITITPK